MAGQLFQSKLCTILSRIMPSAEVTFISANWVNNYSPETISFMYDEIVDYFTDQVINEVLSKYDNFVDLNPQTV
jgi:hypothetical protein